MKPYIGTEHVHDLTLLQVARCSESLVHSASSCFRMFRPIRFGGGRITKDKRQLERKVVKHVGQFNRIADRGENLIQKEGSIVLWLYLRSH
eukprot:3379541-Amphidinium_carterae.2